MKIDQQVRKNRVELKFAVFFPFFPIVPQIPFFPVEGFGPQQILRNAKEWAKSALDAKLAPLAQLLDDYE